MPPSHPKKINKIVMLHRILVYCLFALTTALHYNTPKAQDEKIPADETLYSTCFSLFLHYFSTSNGVLICRRTKYMPIKRPALAVSCKTLLFIPWTMEMQSDHFLVYRMNHITKNSVKYLCLDHKNAAVLTTPL